MASNKRKQDEKHLKMLREMVALPHNKQCFDCHQRGPTYVDMTIGSFVCTSCSGILRGLNPPHRVKSISMASFSVDEMDFLKCHGNELCRKVFLGLYDSRSWPEPDSRDEQRVRDFMVQKYENKRWYVAPTESMKEEARRMNEVSASKQPAQKPLRSLLGENATKLVIHNNQSPQMNRTAPANPGAISAPPGAPQPVQPPQPTAVAQPKPQPQPQQGSGFDLLGDLGGDPFASTPPASSGGGGFADFSNFGSQPTPATQAPPPSAFPMSSAPLQPLGSSPATATAPSAPPSQTPPNTGGGGGGGGDKYAALADLDSVFGTATTTAAPVNPPAGGNMEWGGTTVAGSGSALNWGGQATSVGGGNINWNGTTSSTSGSAPAAWNSQPQPTAANSTSSIFSNTSSTTAANPFGGSTSTTQAAAPPAPAQANPFGGAGQGFQQQPVGFGQFGGQPTTQPASAGFGQFGMQNGSGAFGTTAAGFPGFTQSAPAGANPGFGAQPQTGFAAAQTGFPTQPQGFAGGWGQPVQPAGNPFMVSSYPSMPAQGHHPMATQMQTPQSGQMQTPQSGQMQTPYSGQMPTPYSGQMPTPHLGQMPTPHSSQMPTPHSVQMPTPHSGQMPAQMLDPRGQF
ncbi:arf-GAP domain and FG repeat-containing protein 1-like isoform X1 [Haliotis cracherodii]|uniref:arf-GAP domain and FG repeat-containing protein 1-like isoform X1 n=1 Tax=Haliotis cracherodii TaxID=6455 RepID=UPI0039ED22B2